MISAVRLTVDAFESGSPKPVRCYSDSRPGMDLGHYSLACHVTGRLHDGTLDVVLHTICAPRADNNNQWRVTTILTEP